jgi:UPF0755 protein
MLPGPLKDDCIVIVEPRTSIKGISKLLYQNEVISSPFLFHIISKIYSKTKAPLKSGEYSFGSGISPLQVIRILSSGKSILRRLLIPEGVTVHDIITKLEERAKTYRLDTGKYYRRLSTSQKLIFIVSEINVPKLFSI